MKDSPYLKHDDRLAHVISALQVMAIYKFYKLDFESWAERISGDKQEANKWESIFTEHPEFFRLDQQRQSASLVWRRSYPKSFNVDTYCELTKDEYHHLSPENKNRISRKPLKESEITSLITSAINLHSRALQHKQDRRWWIPLVIGFILGFVPFLIKLIWG